MPFRGLQDKVVIVTGAASGIGEGACRRLIEEGARVVGADLSGDALNKLASELGPNMIGVEANVAQDQAGDKIVKAALEKFGAVHGLVNNAGTASKHFPVAEMPLEEYDRVHGVNMRGAFIVLKAALRQMIAQNEGGSIVNIASIGALRANRGSFPYGASKRAMIGLSNAAALENGQYNIRVNTVCPGPIQTAMMAVVTAPRPGVSGEAPPRLDTAIKRIGTPAEAASLICYLLSDEASFQTAGVYTVDGGMIH